MKSHFRQLCFRRTATPFPFRFQVFCTALQFSEFFRRAQGNLSVFRLHFLSCLSAPWVFFLTRLWIGSFFILVLGSFSECFIFTFSGHCFWLGIIFCVEGFSVWGGRFWTFLCWFFSQVHRFFVSCFCCLQMPLYVIKFFFQYLMSIFDAFVKVQCNVWFVWIRDWIWDDFVLRDFCS